MKRQKGAEATKAPCGLCGKTWNLIKTECCWNCRKKVHVRGILREGPAPVIEIGIRVACFERIPALERFRRSFADFLDRQTGKGSGRAGHR